MRARTDPAARLKSINAETKVVLEQLERDYKAPEEKVVVKKFADSINAVINDNMNISFLKMTE